MAVTVVGPGDLYGADLADASIPRIQKRDTEGSWSVLATGEGSAPGQFGVISASGLAVDTAGNLYVVDTGNHRVQVYTPLPGP